MIYETMLLFGVVFIAGWVFDTLSQSRHAMTLRHARQFWLFLVVGAYFVFFWHRGGQTLAMKTWHIKLIAPKNGNIPIMKAIMRYLLSWIWFLPAMAIDYALGLKGWSSIGLLAAGMIVWAITAFFDKDHQFFHDRLLGIYLINFSTPLHSHRA